MPYVNMPNDLPGVKTKLAFNLTKRQRSPTGLGAPQQAFSQSENGECIDARPACPLVRPLNVCKKFCEALLTNGRSPHILKHIKKF